MATTTIIKAPLTSTTTGPRVPGTSPISDGALLERMSQMRRACEGLAADLALARRRLRLLEAELERVKRTTEKS